MRPVVRDAFIPFTSKFEGVCYHMYLDVKCLVTTGIGNLIDRPQDALRLPWVHQATNAPATAQEIVQAWNTVKGATVMAPMGGGAFAALTDLRLTPDGLADLVYNRLDNNNAFLCSRFHDFEQWPADAQLGTLSIAWAAGPGWKAPKFDALAAVQDWAGICGPEGAMGEFWLNDQGNPGLRPRNLANKVLFGNAAVGKDPGTLYYPEALNGAIVVVGDQNPYG